MFLLLTSYIHNNRLSIPSFGYGTVSTDFWWAGSIPQSQKKKMLNKIAKLTITSTIWNTLERTYAATSHSHVLELRTSSPIPFQGNENVMVENAKTINISHIGNISIPTHSKFWKLRHVLHTHEILKQLINVTKLCYDKNVYVEFQPIFFLVKDQCPKKVLLQHHFDHGLYKLNTTTKLLPPSSTLSPSSSS